MENKQSQKNITDWKHVKLGELYTITSSKRVFQDEWTAEGVSFYRAREIVKLSENGFVDNDLYISRKMFEEYKNKYGVPKKDDLLITGVGTIGMVYRVIDNREFYFKDGNIIWFKSKGLVSSAFIEQLYKSPITKNKLLGSSPITTVATYTIDAAKKAVVYLPPLPEQNRIVSVLETWDKAIEKLNKKIELKKEIKKGLMQKLLTGVVRLPGFTEKWETVKLEIIGNIISGGTPSKQNENFWKGTIPWISSSDLVDDDIKYINVHRYITNDAVKDSATKIVPPKSLVFVSRVGVGKMVVNEIAICTSQDFQSLILKDHNTHESYFLAYLLIVEMQKFLSNNQGTSIKGFLKKDLENFIITLPKGKKEQTAIANVITTADKEILELQKKLTLFQDQKKYLLNNLITGAIRTPETLKIN